MHQGHTIATAGQRSFIQFEPVDVSCEVISSVLLQNGQLSRFSLEDFWFFLPVSRFLGNMGAKLKIDK